MEEQIVDLIFAHKRAANYAVGEILEFKTQPKDITNNGAELRLTFDSLSEGYDWFNDNFAALGKLPPYKDKWADNEQDTGHATIAERNGWN